MRRKTLWRLLLLPFLLVPVFCYDWDLGDRQTPRERFIYENF